MPNTKLRIFFEISISKSWNLCESRNNCKMEFRMITKTSYYKNHEARFCATLHVFLVVLF